jgi:hypothetical protein
MDMDMDINLPSLPSKTPFENTNIFEAMTRAHKRNSDSDIQYYQPNLIVESLFYIYLRKKYKSKCFADDLDINAIEIKLKIDLSLPLNRNYLDNIVQLNSVILEKIYTCIKHNQELIIIPIGIDIMIDGIATSGHANVLIYRRDLHQLEHFEPHGATFFPSSRKTALYNEYISNSMNSIVFFINKFMMRDRLPLVSYMPPNTVCPYIHGIQRLEGKSQLKKTDKEGRGYCLVWSFFFTELVLRNPHMTSLEIVQSIFELLERYDAEERGNFLRRIARGYSHIINEKLQKYFKGASKTIQKMSIQEISDKLEEINDVEFTYEINTHLTKMKKKFSKMSHSAGSRKKVCKKGKRCNKTKRVKTNN